jgi:hypothetical protein
MLYDHTRHTVTHCDMVTFSHTWPMHCVAVSHSVVQCHKVPPPMQGICKQVDDWQGYVVVSQDCNQMHTKLSEHAPMAPTVDYTLSECHWASSMLTRWPLCHSMLSGPSQHQWHHHYEEITAIPECKCVVWPISRTKPDFRMISTRNGS